MTDSENQRAARLRVLVVTPSVPYPPIWGFGIRVLQFVRHLVGRGHHVTVLTFAGPEDARNVTAMLESVNGASAAGGSLRVEVVPPPLSSKAVRRRAQAKSLLSPTSFQRSERSSPALQQRLDSLLGQQRFDVLQVESSQMFGLRFPAGPGAPLLILDEHNIEYELLQRMYRGERSPLRRLYNWSEYLKFRREEQASWRRADGVLLTSEREEVYLRSLLPGVRCATAPNGVDVDYFTPSDVAPAPNNVVMTGLMRYRPNNDGALFFAREVLPLIHRQRPDVTFTVVGAGPPPELEAVAGERVHVTGQVEDVRPYIESAAAVVVPLRMGGGTRLKVLEGLAMAKPMVSTALGCEGIAVRDGEHLLIADAPDALAAAVLRVLEDTALASRLGAAGRALAASRYSWSAVVDGLESFIEGGLGARPGAEHRAPHPAEDRKQAHVIG